MAHTSSFLTSVLVLLSLSGTSLSGTAQAQQTTAVAAPTRVFPAAATPGETAWIIGQRGLPGRGTLSLGGQNVPYQTDARAGWLRFQVPTQAAGGPQTIRLAGVNQSLTLNVLKVPAGTDTLLYVRPERAQVVQQEYARRLQALSASCERSCPAEVQATLKSLGAQPAPRLTPLNGTPARAANSPAPTTVRPPLNLNLSVLTQLLRPPVTTPPTTTPTPSICATLSGTVPTGGLPLGQVLSLLELIFSGDLQTDPTWVGYPTQSDAPYRNEPPTTVIQKTLGQKRGNGKGVTVHVLDTAAAGEDPFMMPRTVNYYGQEYKDRPYHGRAIGQIVQAVAPGATLDYQQVCDKGGSCSTLKVVQALCAVAADARRGGRHVVNLSVGGPNPTRGLELALREVTALGVPVAASYGNRDDCAGLVKGDRCNHYPADWTRTFEFGPAINLASRSLRPTMLLSVAGWDIAGRQLATYNRGVGNPGVLTELPSVQAPGEFWLGGYPYFGTSFAAPVVSGVLANWMSCQGGVPLLPLLPGDQAPIASSVVNACP